MKSRLDLRLVVNRYKLEIGPRAHAELDWFRQQTDVQAAIDSAGPAVNSQGKRHPHQYRLSSESLDKATSILTENRNRIEQFNDFHELFTWLDKSVGWIHGIGELYIYDTCLRLGANLRFLPQKVYLHRGTRRGARNFPVNYKAATIEVTDLPPEFHELEPYEVEDVLCIFKDYFRTGSESDLQACLRKHCWCE